MLTNENKKMPRHHLNEARRRAADAGNPRAASNRMGDAIAALSRAISRLMEVLDRSTEIY